MEALRRHWFLYVYEGAELAWFMVAACVCTVVLFGAASPVVRGGAECGAAAGGDGRGDGVDCGVDYSLADG